MTSEPFLKDVEDLRLAGDKTRALALLRERADKGTLAVTWKAIKIAGAFHALEQLDEAERIYQGVLALNPNDFWATAGQAVVFRKRGMRDKAAELFVSLADHHPDHSHPRLEASTEFAALGLLTEALVQLDHAIQIEPGNLLARCRRASFLQRQGDSHSALLAYEEVLASDPNHVQGRLGAAKVLADIGQLQQAIGHVDSVLSSNPGHAAALSDKAGMLHRYGDAEGALRIWREAIHAFPQVPLYRLKLASLWSAVGADDRAYNELIQATDQFPYFPDAKLQAGRAARKLGYRREALQWLRDAAKAMPDNPRVIVECAQELAHLEDFAEAKRCLDLVPEPVASLRDAAMLKVGLAVRDDEPDARRSFQFALKNEQRIEELVWLVRHSWQWGFQREAIQALEALMASGTVAQLGAVRIALARSYMQVGEFENAAQPLAHIEDITLTAQDLLDVADIRFELDDVQGARCALQEVLTHDVLTRTELERALGICDATGHIELGDSFLAHGASLDPSAPPRVTPRKTVQALRLAKQGRPQQASALIEVETRATPGFPEKRWQARLALAAGDHPAAVATLGSHVSASSPLALDDAKLWIKTLIDAEEIDRAWDTLTTFEGRFSPREFVLQRAEILRRNLRFEDELECLQSALKRDPINEGVAHQLVHTLIDRGDVDTGRKLLDQWRIRRPAALGWLHAQLHWGWHAYTEWPPMLALHEEVIGRVTPRARPDLFINSLDNLMRRGLHEEAEVAVNQFLPGIADLPLHGRRKAQLLVNCAQRLAWLGRNAQSRSILDRVLASPDSVGMEDRIYRVSCANEAYGGDDFDRYRLHRGRLHNPRHHLAFTEFRSAAPNGVPPIRVAVLLHIFYQEMWPELRRYLAALKGTAFQLFVSVNRDTISQDVLSGILEFDPTAQIRYVENRGFDIGGHWQNLEGVKLQDFDVALLLQTKKNNHTRIGHKWRKNLLEALMGTPDQWRDNLWAFVEQPNVGMIGSGLHRNSFDFWTYGGVRDVLRALEMPTDFDKLKLCYEHVAGTMFLIRANLLGEMHAKTNGRIPFETYGSLPLYKRFDLTYAHAMERAFGMYVRWRGFTTLWRGPVESGGDHPLAAEPRPAHAPMSQQLPDRPRTNAMEQTTEMQPAETKARQAQEAAKAGNLPLALTLIEAAIALDPMIARFHLRQSEWLDRLGKMDDALRVAEHAAVLAPQHAYVKAHLAQLLGRKGDLTRALLLIEEAIQQEPAVAIFQLSKSMILHRTARLDEAIAAARLAVDLAPAHARAKTHLATLMALSGDVAAARQLVDQAIPLGGEPPQLRQQLGRLTAHLAETCEPATKEATPAAVESNSDAAGALGGSTTAASGSWMRVARALLAKWLGG